MLAQSCEIFERVPEYVKYSKKFLLVNFFNQKKKSVIAEIIGVNLLKKDLEAISEFSAMMKKSQAEQYA